MNATAPDTQSLFNNIDWGLIVAFIAVLISLFSLYYTHKHNKRSEKITLFQKLYSFRKKCEEIYEIISDIRLLLTSRFEAYITNYKECKYFFSGNERSSLENFNKTINAYFDCNSKLFQHSFVDLTEGGTDEKIDMHEIKDESIKKHLMRLSETIEKQKTRLFATIDSKIQMQ